MSTVLDVTTTPEAGTPAATRTRGLALTGAQEVTFTELLAVGGARPISPAGLAEELHALILEGTGDALRHWTEGRLWVSKSVLSSVQRCEGSFLAERSAPAASTLHPATAVGIVSHRAIQIAYTHPGLAPGEAVDAALTSAQAEEAFGRFWAGASIGTQSDLLMRMVSRVTLFLDSWPPLSPKWAPRFEESLQARVGGLTLAARPDLVLGRPSPTHEQRMLLCDLKSSALAEHHVDEAQFYALVATLRFGDAPFRSVVYSLASGEYTDPEVNAVTLRRAAERVVESVNAMVDLLTERRVPAYTGGAHCRWCPLRDTCATGAEALAAA